MHRSSSAVGAALLVATFALVFGFASASCGDSSKKPGCKSDKDCKNKQVCSAGSCVQCNTDRECPVGQRCSAHACVQPECSNDAACNGKVCQAGKCKACATDAECGPGRSCTAGMCVAGKACSKNEDCADDEDCVNGSCRKAGAASSPGDATCTLATVYFAFDDSTVQPSERDRLGANVACIEQTKGKTVYLMWQTLDPNTIFVARRTAGTWTGQAVRVTPGPTQFQVPLLLTFSGGALTALVLSGEARNRVFAVSRR